MKITQVTPGLITIPPNGCSRKDNMELSKEFQN
jgi:hypothetical protein